MGKEFQHIITVNSSDIDELGHVNNVVYVRWVQEVAAAHWSAVASPELQDRYKWVVLRHEIDYRNPAFPGDEIAGTTWVGQHHGARFERFVRLLSIRGDKIVAEAKTVWCMIDAASGRPARINDIVLSLL